MVIHQNSFSALATAWLMVGWDTHICLAASEILPVLATARICSIW